MKMVFYMFIAIIAMTLFVSCEDNNDILAVKPVATGTMVDKEGNEYKWVRIGSQDWMAENLKCGTPYYELTEKTAWGSITHIVGISDFGMAQQYLVDFGNYYSYQQALKNCPEGWRLPADDDWKKLEIALGMSSGDTEKEGWRSGAANLMIQTGEQGTGLNLRFGGELCKWGYGNDANNSVKTYRQYDEGIYWTSTIDTGKSNECVFYRRIMPNIDKVERHSATTFAHYFCVRYMRDAN